MPDWSVTTASPVSYSPLKGRLLEALELLSERADRRLDLVGEIGLELVEARRVFELAREPPVGLEALRDPGVLGADLLGPLLVIPEARLAHRLLELGLPVL